MRAPTRAIRILQQGAVLSVALLLGGCATMRSTMGAWRTGPDGISRPQLERRESLERGDYASLLAHRDDDELLDLLQRGTASYYAAAYTRSAAIMDSAALVADDRITRRLSREGLSLVTNDMARPYDVRRTERLFIPYYALLSYAALGAWEDAAVEARRLSALLAQYADDRSEDERGTFAALHYLAATAFERAGNHGEAEVARRNAQALDSVKYAATAAPGRELVVLVERGFVAHRTTGTVSLRVGDDDDEGRGSDGHEHGPRDPDRSRGHDDDGDHDHDLDAQWITVAFPELRPGRPVTSMPLLFVDSTPRSLNGARASLDQATGADERRERAAMLIRAGVRATAKYSVAQVVKERKGKTAGSLVHIGASLLERADVRSWHLLPAELLLTRIPLAAGSHRVLLDGEMRTIAVDNRSPALIITRLYRDRSSGVPLRRVAEVRALP